MSDQIRSYHVTRTASHNVMSCHTMSRHATLCHTVSCHAVSCHVMSYRVVSCHVMSCHCMIHRVVRGLDDSDGGPANTFQPALPFQSIVDGSQGPKKETCQGSNDLEGHMAYLHVCVYIYIYIYSLHGAHAVPRARLLR